MLACVFVYECGGMNGLVGCLASGKCVHGKATMCAACDDNVFEKKKDSDLVIQLRELGISQRGFLDLDFLVEALGLENLTEAATALRRKEALNEARSGLEDARRRMRPANTGKPAANIA